jgi:hypothetical protein
MSLLHTLLTEYQQYTPSDVYDKISSANRKSTDSGRTDTVCFGLEDSDGNIVKVHVQRNQAPDFEQELSRRLADQETATQPEIAELLFDMHSQFEIVDVEYPTITQDEETDIPPGQNGDQTDPALADPNVDPNAPIDPNAPVDELGDMGQVPPEGAEDPAATSALQSVIQAMSADAEARRQESLAKAAEARAREAEAAARIADGKLKAEEEVADMEAFYGDQQVGKQEAKKMAKLARYRHQLKQREDNTGEFADYDEADARQQEAGEQRVDTAPGTVAPSLGGTPASAAPTEQEEGGVEQALRKTGMEDEQVDVNGPKTPNRQFDKVQSLVDYLLTVTSRRTHER